MRSPRLADVAEAAGVSEATVSRVLNAKPGIADRTRTAVLAAVDMLGYDRPAKLRKTRVGLVGLVVPELANPIFPAFVQAIETALAARDVTPILCTQVPGGIGEDDYVQMMCERGVSGIIFVSGLHADTTTSLERYRALRARGLELVMVNGYREGLDATFVSCDDVAAVRQAVSHLVTLGHRRIGLAVGPERFVPALRAVTGFRQGMAEFADTSDVVDLIASDFYTVMGGRRAGARLLQQGCSAVICASDVMALGVVAHARERGLRVPEDVSVVGHDDSPFNDHIDPPLTTLRQDVTAMSEAAVRALLAPGGTTSGAEVTFSAELIVRGSTAPHLAISPVPHPRP